MKILLIGSNGQLGRDLLGVLSRQSEHQVIGLTHAQIEVKDLESVRAALAAHSPQIVINTAAFHKVDVCEDQVAETLAVNVLGPRHLALACREQGCALMHMSTDYVFGGKQRVPYAETDPVDPINVYGISKAAGEMAIRYLCEKHFIVRTSGLYGVAGASGKGGNFVELMLRLAREGKAIRVVDDQTLTPTYTYDLARQLAALVTTDVYGTYHATCQGACTWFDFACAIFEFSGLTPELAAQTTVQSGARAKRPAYSVLDNAALRNVGLDLMPEWQQSLRAYLGAR